MDLTKLQNDAFSQMVGNDDIASNLSESLKERILKVGVLSVLAVTAFCSSGMAHADNGDKALPAVSGLSAMAGILTDGSKPSDIPSNCNVTGTNGWKIGGAGVAGAVALNQFGKGNGRALLTGAAGYLAANAAQNAENNRMREECLRQQAQNQRVNPSYNNPYPNYSPNAQAPQAEILYAVKNAQGLPMYVTVNDSPGLNALRGQRMGSMDPSSDPIVSNALEKSLHNMERAYANLDTEAKQFVSLSYGRDTAGKLSRYAVSTDEIQAGQGAMNLQRDRVNQQNDKFQSAFIEYAKTESVFAQIADNAAVDGFNLTSYSQAVELMKAPASVQVAYNGKSVNHYSTFNNNFANR